jgi:hypothetical protein
MKKESKQNEKKLFILYGQLLKFENTLSMLTVSIFDEKEK